MPGLCIFTMTRKMWIPEGEDIYTFARTSGWILLCLGLIQSGVSKVYGSGCRYYKYRMLGKEGGPYDDGYLINDITTNDNDDGVGRFTMGIEALIIYKKRGSVSNKGCRALSPPPLE